MLKTRRPPSAESGKDASDFTAPYLLFDLIKFLNLALRFGGRHACRFALGSVSVSVVGGDVTAFSGVPDDVTGGGRFRNFTSVGRRASVEQLFADGR